MISNGMTWFLITTLFFIWIAILTNKLNGYQKSSYTAYDIVNKVWEKEKRYWESHRHYTINVKKLNLAIPENIYSRISIIVAPFDKEANFFAEYCDKNDSCIGIDAKKTLYSHDSKNEQEIIITK